MRRRRDNRAGRCPSACPAHVRPPRPNYRTALQLWRSTGHDRLSRHKRDRKTVGGLFDRQHVSDIGQCGSPLYKPQLDHRRRDLQHIAASLQLCNSRIPPRHPQNSRPPWRHPARHAQHIREHSHFYPRDSPRRRIQPVRPYTGKRTRFAMGTCRSRPMGNGPLLRLCLIQCRRSLERKHRRSRLLP